MRKKISKDDKNQFLFKTVICLVLLLMIFLLPKYSNKVLAVEQGESPEFLYLSDIPYDTQQSRPGWGSIHINGTDSGAQFSVKVEGALYSFEKGIWAHASSTVVYNLTDYQDYDYFTTYMGVNNSSGNRGNGVKFYIYTSEDGTNWNLKTEENPLVIKSSNDAIFVKIDIKNAKFLKLVANDNGANGNDHSVYVDPKLIKETYKEPGEDLIPSIEELDTKIKQFVDSNADLSTNKEYELTLLKREFISRVGNYALKTFLGESEENRLVYEWLVGDVDILRLYVLGGIPDGGSYYNSLGILAKLYKEYSSDFKNTELLNNPTYPEMTYGDLYKKMAMSIALTHSQRIGLWMNSSMEVNQSDPLRRYAIFKYIHKNGRMVITSRMDMTHMFEDLHVEEMRLLVSNNIDDEEILWLNRYVQDNVDNNPNNVWRYITPHPYMAYVWPNYANPVYYDSANVSYFNELFAINKTDDNVGRELVNGATGEKTGKIGIFDSEFVIPGGKNVPEYRLKITRGTEDNKVYKVWMNFRNKFGTGAVCGGISKSGANIRGTHGIPAIVVGQPGHAALLFYSKDEKGRGYWRLDNDVSGWTATGKSARFLGWGNGSHTSGYTGVYMEFEQAAVNDHENLIKAEEQVMLANVYRSDLADETKKQAALRKQEELYRKALEIQSINFDAWLGLINVYNEMETKTEDDFYNLAEEIAENLKHYPLPMYNATNLIKPRLTSIENSYKFTLLQTRILTQASTLPNNTADSFTVVQPGVTRLEASFLLGSLDKTIATFSFDGEDAGKIVLSSRFDNTGVRWDYSLDGKQTWHEVSFGAEEEHKLQLTKRQIDSITSENDIYVHIVGVNYDEKNLYKIDITEQALLATLFPSDLENRVVGVNLSTEWRYNETDAWNSYSVVSPDLTGNKTVQVRQSATGTKLASPASGMYTFTEDNQPDTRKYIPVSHLTIPENGVSSQATNQSGAAVFAIDANYNTRWHSAWNGTDTNRFIILKLDKPVYLSAVEFVPAGGGNGKILYGTIYGSMDGENWEVLSQKTGLTYTNQANTVQDAITNTKSFEIENPKEVQYVKIVANRATNGNWFAARAFNLYQDLTRNPHPTAGIAYSVTEPTNGIVVARLINPSTEITITNNDGKDTYVFTKNGEFTFEFEDKYGNEGTAIAKVTWIDKDGPTADIDYGLDDDKKLRVLLDNISEDVYLLDENNNKINYIEVNENKKITNITYLDNEGNAYKILDKDEEGNTTKITYKNTTGDVSNVATYITTLENGVVTAEEYFDSEGNSVTLEENQKEILRELQQTTRSNPLEYALDTSGEYEFKLLDKAENLLYKSIKVDYIENNTKILASDITYNITKLTNTDVEATLNPYIIDTNGDKEVSVITTSEGGNTHTFTENGQFTFQYKEASDENNFEVKEHEASVNWIDKKAPVAEITYSTTQKTNQEVIATIRFDKENVTVVGGNTHTFTENGDFTFEFMDKAGNEGRATASVDWIDKSLPVAKITYSETELTNQDVVATVTFDKENVTVAGGNTHTFTENGDFTFEYTTEQGDTGTIVAHVSWIDKRVPVATITYSKTELTNQDVIAMLSFDENNVSITGGNGHRFTENGVYTFEFTDLAGNKGTIEARVDWIDKTAPTAQITYSTEEATSEAVVATLTNPSEEIRITNNDGKDTYTFTENGKFTFEFVDLAGNKGTIEAKVDWIDKTAPTAEIRYSTEEATNQDVVATLINPSEEIRITNNDGKDTYTFTENGKFTFEFVDLTGNKGTIEAKVDWIDKTAPTAEIRYSTEEATSEAVVATLTNPSEKIKITNNNGNDTYTFTKNGEFTFEFVDEAGNKGSKKAVVSWITIPDEPENPDNPDNPDEYKLGDINHDGKITATDLLLVKRHLVAGQKQEWILTGDKHKSGDINGDGAITATDLIQLKRLVLKQMETH